MSDLPPSVPDSPAVDYVTVFEGARPRLVGLAYRITGSLVDAEDVVSEVWLRWAEADHDAVDRPQAWLTTVTARRAIDWARATARRRETYLGPWLPEPMVTTWPSAADPEAAAELAESLSFGFLTVLDRLDPVARAVFLLVDVWGVVLRRGGGCSRGLRDRMPPARQPRPEAPTRDFHRARPSEGYQSGGGGPVGRRPGRW